MTTVNGTATVPITQTATSKDGTRISYQTVGAGISLIVVPGALSTADDYMSLATTLSDTFATHIVQRRGRGLSGPMGDTYSIAKECEDIEAVQKETNAHFVFGHSYGGLIALEAARNNSALRKIAVYEPGVSINQSISVHWGPSYKAYLESGKPLDAFIDFVRSTGPTSMKWIPRWWLRFILPRVVRGDEWGKIVSLLPSNLIEHIEVARLNDTYSNYREVSAEALLMSGGKSPEFREQTLQTLHSVLCASKIKILPKLDHFGPTRGAPSIVAEMLKAYFR